MKPVVLRLDSGALIGTPSEFGITSSEPLIRISAEEAAKMGRLDYSHVLHARKLLKQAVEELGYDAKNCPELQTDDEVEEVSCSGMGFFGSRLCECEGRSEGVGNDTPPKKRDRGGEKLLKGGWEGHGDLGSTSSRSPAVSSSLRLEFYDKCFKILEDTIQDLGKDASIFMAPVDPRDVPDYFSFVKEPMDLGTIQKRLEQGFYESSRDFAEDVRLVWSNCFLYNKKGEYIEKIGRRGSMCFENHWAMSGLAEEPRLKRLNAGRPAQKYEPEEPNTETPTKKASKGIGRNPKTRTKQGKAGRNVAPGDVDDISSKVEHTSYEDRNMSTEDKQNLALCLGQLTGSMLDDVLKIMRENGNIDMKDDVGGEIELELGDFNNRTLWKLDAYLKERNVQPVTEAAVVINKESSSESSSSFSSSESDSEVSSKTGE